MCLYVFSGIWGQWLFNKDSRYQALLAGGTTMAAVLPCFYIINTTTPGDSMWYLMMFIFGLVLNQNPPNVRAMLQTVTTPETRGTAFGLLNLADDLGKGSGPALVVLIIDANDGNKVAAFNWCTSLWLVCGGLLAVCYFTMGNDERRAQLSVRDKIMAQHELKLARLEGRKTQHESDNPLHAQAKEEGFIERDATIGEAVYALNAMQRHADKDSRAGNASSSGTASSSAMTASSGTLMKGSQPVHSAVGGGIVRSDTGVINPVYASKTENESAFNLPNEVIPLDTPTRPKPQYSLIGYTPSSGFKIPDFDDDPNEPMKANTAYASVCSDYGMLGSPEEPASRQEIRTSKTRNSLAFSPGNLSLDASLEYHKEQGLRRSSIRKSGSSHTGSPGRDSPTDFVYTLRMTQTSRSRTPSPLSKSSPARNSSAKQVAKQVRRHSPLRSADGELSPMHRPTSMSLMKELN
jgi:hypothetical protein